MTCIQEYHQLIADLDAEIVRITELHGTTVSCGPGCASCCLAFSVLPIEAACLREAIGAQPAASRELFGCNLAENPERCPLLIDDLCGVYAARPVICRTQGLPLAYVDEERETIEVSACALNFPDNYGFVPEELLFLDQFNLRLAELNQAWCRKQNLDPNKRIPLRELVCAPRPEP